MSAESLIFDALQGLVDTRVYPDFAPENTDRPYITYQQVGGDSINFLQQVVPSKANARFQVNVWADTRQAASDMALQAETALRMAADLQTIVLGAPVALYEPELNFYGTRQDFSVWS